MGNPPWVNWEYLSPRYRAGSQHLWGEYGLLQVKGPRLGFSKEDVSTLFTCAALDRFLVPGGRLSFILRQATFRSAQNGAGFRRFHLDGPGLDFRVLKVEDLGRIRPFDGICTPVALGWYSSSGMPATFSLSPTGTGRQSPASGGRSGHRTRRLPPFFPLCGWRT